MSAPRSAGPRPHLHVIQPWPPMGGWGSAPILHRHLTRFADDGWKVTVVSSAHMNVRDDAHGPWRQVLLPMRRAWWPPYRAHLPLLARTRVELLARECRRAAGARPDAILTILEPTLYAQAAARAAQQWGVPLNVIMHDVPEEWEALNEGGAPARARARAEADVVLAAADRVFPVTPALAARYGPALAPRTVPLLPLPAGWDGPRAVWQPAHATQPRFLFIGSMHGFQRPTVERLARVLAPRGGTVEIIAHLDEALWQPVLKAHLNVSARAPLPRNEDVVAYAAAHATALVVSYSYDRAAQPWAETSFPSKLLEIAHGGVPVLLLAPPWAAAAAWADRAGWPLHVAAPDDTRLAAAVDHLTTRAGWEAQAAGARAAADGPFDPVALHTRLDAHLALAGRPLRPVLGEPMHRPTAAAAATP